MDPNHCKNYVVVEFLSTGEVVTILRPWMISDLDGPLYCFWPNQDVRKALITNKMPQDTWEVWEVRILASCDDLKEALRKERKAQETSDLGSCAETDHGEGYRIKGPIQRLDSESNSGDSNDDLPPPNKKRSLINPSFPLPRRPSHCYPTNIFRSPSIDSFQRDSSSKNQLNSPGSSKSIIPKGNSQKGLKEEIPSTSESCDHGASCLRLQEQLERLHHSVNSVRMEVREVLDMVSQLVKGKTRPDFSLDNEFLKQFPITSLEDFVKLEDSMSDDETSKLMVEFFSKIGGSTVDEAVKRSLVRLLTSEVAVSYSWEGRKGKRPLKNLLIVKILEKVLLNSFPEFTNKVFEHRVREWFRQAGTRISNKEKNLSI